MPLQMLRRNITELKCDAIVDPTDCGFSGSGGVDLAIHTAAGAALDAACSRLEPLGFGETAVTDGFDLPCRYIIHTAGPIWQGGTDNEAMLLRSCYINSLFKAKSLGLHTVAFPLISSGAFGFPKDKVLKIAADAISDFLFNVDSELDVFICITDHAAFELNRSAALREYLDNSCFPCYDAAADLSEQDIYDEAEHRRYAPAAPQKEERRLKSKPYFSAIKPDFSKIPSLSDWIKKQDDSFAVTLLKLIDKKGMDDVECYKKANVTKNTFWKIKNSASYKPSKPTVIAFAIALELDMNETQQLLRSAGFSLSHSNLFDMIIEFYITNGVYDIFEINAALYQYDQTCLGC